MQKKRRKALILAIYILFNFMLSFVFGTAIKAEETEATEKKEIVNYNLAVVGDKQVDEFYFYNISLFYDGRVTTLCTYVKNTGTETFTDRIFTIELIKQGYVLVEMHGYVGDSFEPEEKKTIVSSVGRNVVDADMMIISVEGREKNQLIKNLTSDVIGSRIVEERAAFYNIMVYKAHSKWLFRCDVIGICDCLWNQEVEYILKDGEGQEIERFRDRLPESLRGGDLHECVETTDIDLAQAASLEIHLIQRNSPEIIWEEMAFIDNTANEDIKVEQISAIREENSSLWKLTCRITNNGSEACRIIKADTSFCRANADERIVVKSIVQQELEVEETKDIVLTTEQDIEATDYIEIELLAEVLEVPEITPFPTPTVTPIAMPEETQSAEPLPKITPTVEPTPEITPIVVPTREPEKTPSSEPLKKPEETPEAPPEETVFPRETQMPETISAELSEETQMLAVLPTLASVETKEDSLDYLTVKGLRVRQKGAGVCVQWSKNKWAAGYQIFRSRNRSKGYKYLGEVRKKTYYDVGVKRVLRTNRTQYVVLQARLQTHILVSVLPRRGF